MNKEGKDIGENAPENARTIKSDVKDMALMIVLKVSQQLARTEVPYFDRLVVACAYESIRIGIERKRSHK